PEDWLDDRDGLALFLEDLDDDPIVGADVFAGVEHRLRLATLELREGALMLALLDLQFRGEHVELLAVELLGADIETIPLLKGLGTLQLADRLGIPRLVDTNVDVIRGLGGLQVELGLDVAIHDTPEH